MKYYSEQNPDITMRSTQSSFFNRQTQASAVVQPKLTVGTSNDAHEREADQTADRVMHKSEGTPMSSMTPIAPIQRKCDQCEKEEKVNRKETGMTGGFTAPPSVSRAISRSGQALEPTAKTFMESRFNRKFDGVQVHTDGEAANSARDISAKAYTSGNHIVFGEGQYQPNTEGGRHLLAHELTHVVQQGKTLSVQRLTDESLEGRYESRSPMQIFNCASLGNRSCNGTRCRAASGNLGSCMWTGISGGCICRDTSTDAPPISRSVPYWLWALGGGAALAACFATGVCEVGIVIGAVGAASAAAVILLLRAAGVTVTGSQTA